LGYLVKAVRRRNRTDLDGFEQDVVARRAGHGRSRRGDPGAGSALIITLERGLAAKPGGGMRRFVRIGLTTAKKEEVE